MNIRQSFVTAIRNLCVNKMRFAQAMLAMVIGVAGVVFTFGVSSSLLNYSKLEDEEYNSTLLQMHIMTNTDLSKRITPTDMAQAAMDNPDIIKAVSPFVYFDTEGGVRYGTRTPDKVDLYGVGEQYIDMLPVLQIQEGRFLQPMDISREQRVCVVGESIAHDLIGGEALGETLKIYGEDYKIVDVLQAAPKHDEYNWTIYLPYANAKKIVGQRTTPNYDYNCTMYVDKYFVDANGMENMYNAQLAVEEMIASRLDREKGAAWQNLTVSFRFLGESINDTIIIGAYRMMLLAVVILIIGGVGVMNIMQAVVADRTREIGIRKAFGATAEDIRRQSISESAIISLLGGLAGIVLGLIGTYAACIYGLQVSVARGVYYSPELATMDLPVWPIMLALGLAVAVGVIFGTYPAQQAAKMEIVDAINCD